MTTIRLIGRVREEHLEALQRQIESCGRRMVLDLDEVNLVDVDVARFLGACQDQGISVIHCSPYIGE